MLRSEPELISLVTEIEREASASWPEFDSHRVKIAMMLAMLPLRHPRNADEERRYIESDLFTAYVAVMTSHAS